MTRRIAPYAHADIEQLRERQAHLCRKLSQARTGRRGWCAMTGRCDRRRALRTSDPPLSALKKLLSDGAEVLRGNERQHRLTVASVTTTLKPSSVSRRRRSPLRTMTWASTSKTRIGERFTSDKSAPGSRRLESAWRWPRRRQQPRLRTKLHRCSQNSPRTLTRVRILTVFNTEHIT
jgi:hypothetical protein